MMIILLLPILIVTVVNSYTFQAPIDNLLYVTSSSTLFAISSSHLHQLHWSTSNQSLLLLHRRVQLHSSLDSTADDGVSVFVYDEYRQLLLVCARSTSGRCILYDANDISRTYVLDPTMETNYLGCQSGCYTFASSNGTTIFRSAMAGNRVDRNGNIVNSIIELRKDLLGFNLKYQLQSSDDTLITALTFIPERMTTMQDEHEYIYGFDHGQFTYFVLKSSRLARSCQASVAMRMSYEEIPLLFCASGKAPVITGAFFHSIDEPDDVLYIIFDHTVCMYTINEITRAFTASRVECQAGNGFRLAYIVDSIEARPTCEKALDQSVTVTNECAWQPYRSNTYMDGGVGAIGKILHRSATSDTSIGFIFVQNKIVIMGTSTRHVKKFIRYNQTTLYLLHEAIYHNASFNSQYVIDSEHESLIFAIGTELHRYAYNSCTLYDTCRSCVGSRRYDTKPCVWSDGRCSLSSSDSIMYDRGCPPSIDQIKPSNASVNVERVHLKMNGLFEGVLSRSVRVVVNFPTTKPSQVLCTIETVTNDSLTCHFNVPKQPVEGNISISVTPQRSLAIGDTDIVGSIVVPEKFNVYIPKPILVPDYGPSAGGTKIRIQNLGFDPNPISTSSIKVFLGKEPCTITEITSDEIECINQACANETDQLQLSVQMNGYAWQLEKTMFQCQTNPTITDWYPKKAIASGGIKLTVTGQNLNVVQKPTMKFVHNASNLVLISVIVRFCDNDRDVLSVAMIDPSFDFVLPFDLDVSFVMDNVKLVPDENVLTVVNDPVYNPFEGPTKQIDPTSILQFDGSNLASTHSMDQIEVRIGNANNACVPFNLTETYLVCFLSKFAFPNIKTFEPDVEIRIGTNLTFLLGTMFIQNQTQSSSLLLVPHLTRQFGPWTTAALIILTSITILSLLFVFAIFVRRRLLRNSGKFNNGHRPPQYYQDVWCELGKKHQINPKHLTIGEKVGQGCFGDVYRGELQQKTKQSDGSKSLEVAVKVLRDQNVASMQEFLFEANRMKDFSHQNVLSLVGVAWDPFRKAMVLLPYMKNGDLRSYISNEKNRPTVRQLITWGIQVADGMEYLASLKFVHRDLATRNCMLDDQLVCRISDFGLSRDVVDRDYYIVPTTTKGKDGQTVEAPPRRLPIRWLSPESVESSKYTIQSDVWSFGVLLWELLSRGKTPYAGIDNADVFTYVKNGYRLTQPTYCPPLLYKSAMVSCWHVDPTQRPSFTQLAHDIRHILHQLETNQQQQQSSSADDDDTTIVERYPADRKIKRLSTTSMSSSGSIGGQYITTPHRQSENIQLLIDRGGDDEDAYAVAVNSSADVFSTTRLLPRYTETSIVEDA